MKRNLSPSGAAETHITSEVRPGHSGIRATPTPADGVPTDAPVLAAHGPLAAWLRFWFTPLNADGLHVIRVLSGLLFAFWLVTLAGHQEDFFSLSGWFNATAYPEAARLPGGSPVPFGWSILYLCGSDATLLNAVYWGSIAIFLLFAAGIGTRVTAVLAWVAVVSFVANPAISFDADFLLVVLAFYLMVGYVLLGQWSRPLSMPERILGVPDGGVLALVGPGRSGNRPVPSYAANVALRLLQVHFAIVVVTSGLHKLQYGDWWAGAALWYPMHPPLQTTLESIKTGVAEWQFQMFLLSVINYGILAWQLTFPLFAWRRGWWRLVLLGGGLLGWIGSLWIFRLPLFGPVYVIATLSFLSPEEWQAGINQFRNWIKELTGRSRSQSTRASGKTTKVGA